LRLKRGTGAGPRSTARARAPPIHTILHVRIFKIIFGPHPHCVFLENVVYTQYMNAPLYFWVLYATWIPILPKLEVYECKLQWAHEIGTIVVCEYMCSDIKSRFKWHEESTNGKCRVKTTMYKI
jgi:hypothetical protein